MTFGRKASGLYYKNITTVSDTSRVVRMMPQLGAPLTIIILTTLEVSFMLLESSITLLNTFTVKASLIAIVIYNCNNFIVGANEARLKFSNLAESIKAESDYFYLLGPTL